MAGNGNEVMQAIAPVVAAYEQTTQPNISKEQKTEALQYLESFQKSVRNAAGPLSLANMCL
jgi:hypothetical protein